MWTAEDSPGQISSQVDAGRLNNETSRATEQPLYRPYAVRPQPVPPECEPQPPAVALVEQPQCDAEAREECAQLHQQTDALREQLQRVETHLLNEQTRQQTLNHSLAAVNTRVRTLSSELNYWKQQVQRIDADAEQQHRDDLQSLQNISELISRLPRPDTAATAGPTRQ